MSAPTNHWKLGLFVVLGTLLALAAAVFLGSLSLNDESVSYTSYFDESVTGLGVGSPVTFRGVKVGNVAAINVAPDQRHVEVTYKMDTAVLGRLGLATGEGEDATLSVPPDLRAQVASMGVTGVKYLLIDFFDPQTHPPPVLPFSVPKNYIPSASSMLKNIEDSVMRALAEFPRIAQDMSKVLDRLNHILSNLDANKLPDKVSTTLAEVDRTLLLFRGKLGQVNAKELSNEAQAAMEKLNATLSSMQGVMERVGSEQGVLSSMERASDTVGDVALSARDLGPELSETMRDVRGAAESVRQLADALERDSDMLIKGRAQGAER